MTEKDTATNNTASHTETRHIGEKLLNRKLRWSKLALFMEQVWLRLWAPAIILALFLLATLFNMWAYLNPLAHRLVLALFVFALIGSFIPFLTLRWPGDKQALRRLDKNSTLPHQPAQAFRDHLNPAFETTETRQLWLQFKERLVEKIRQLRVSPPRPDTAGKDPYALRILLLMAVVIGLFMHGNNLRPLLTKAFALPPMTDIASLRVDAWVTPPDYTGQPPILIADGGRDDPSGDKLIKSFKVPENAILTIRINGGSAKRVEVRGTNIDLNSAAKVTTNAARPKVPNSAESPKPLADKTSPKPEPENSREFQLTLKKAGPLKLTLDEIPLREWTFEIIDDMPPVIGLVEIPARAQSGALKLKYRVADDYGVIKASARIENVSLDGDASKTPQDETRRPLGSPPEFPLNLPQLVTKEGVAETFRDLMRHPWAGLAGELHLIAEDEGGNKTNSPFIKLQIPETNFTEPMAKSIIKLRKQLIVRPFHARLVSRSIIALMSHKQPFEKDLTLYLGLRFAANRLDNAITREEKEDVATLLYDLARHVEDGDLSTAERELRTAQEALRKALEQNAPASEIEKRIEELKKALQKYMQALAQQQQKQNAQNNQNNQQDQNSQNINPKDFEQMLKTIEELAKSGSKDLAKQMLSQMQQMLENLQTGKNNQQQQNQTAKELEELGKILRQQQQLMDQTFQQQREQQGQRGKRSGQEQQQGQMQGQRQNQRPGEQNGQQRRGQMGQQGEQGRQQGQPLEQQQQTLQQQLENLLSQMRRQQGGQNQQALENAREAMGRAKEQLQGQNLGDALSEEGQALDQLRRGMEQMAREMRKGQPGKGGGQRTGGRDPLGRPGSPSGLDTSESTKVPDEIEIQRAREILRDLQEKLSDPNRPEPELNYFERLLKRF